MAHSHDKTLLARFGFADPDRKNPLHDLACAYLSQPDKMRRLADVARLSWRPPPFKDDDPYRPCRCKVEGVYVADETQYDRSLEVHLQKGTGQYATTVGFLDLVVQAHGRWTLQGRVVDVEGKHAQVEEEYTAATWNSDMLRKLKEQHDLSRYWYTREKRIAVEVKAARETAGDVLRQIALYRAHFDANRWVLASLYDLTHHEHEAMRSAKIMCIRLGGQEFQEFVERAKNTKATGIPEF